MGSGIANFWASHACQGPWQAARLRRVSPPAADPRMCLRRANHGASQWSLQPRPEEGNSLCQDFGSLRDTKESRSGSVPLFGLLTRSRVAGEPVDGASRRKRKPKAGCQGSGCMLFCLFRKYQVKRRRDDILVIKRRRDIPRHLHLFSRSRNRANRRQRRQGQQQNNALYQLPLLRTVRLLGLQTPQCFPVNRPPFKDSNAPSMQHTPTDTTPSAPFI